MRDDTTTAWVFGVISIGSNNGVSLRRFLFSFFAVTGAKAEEQKKRKENQLTRCNANCICKGLVLATNTPEKQSLSS